MPATQMSSKRAEITPAQRRDEIIAILAADVSDDATSYVAHHNANCRVKTKCDYRQNWYATSADWPELASS